MLMIRTLMVVMFAADEAVDTRHPQSFLNIFVDRGVTVTSRCVHDTDELNLFEKIESVISSTGALAVMLPGEEVE